MSFLLFLPIYQFDYLIILFNASCLDGDGIVIVAEGKCVDGLNMIERDKDRFEG